MRRPHTSIIILSAYLVVACRDNKVPVFDDSLKDFKKDSALWYFYAYSFKSKVGFSEPGGQKIFVPAIQCNASVDSVREENGVREYLIRYKKDSYDFSYIYDGLMVYGFEEKDGVFYPLTGMIQLDSFDSPIYVQKHNQFLDSIFTEYLKSQPDDSLSNWLRKEARRRDIK